MNEINELIMKPVELPEQKVEERPSRQKEVAFLMLQLKAEYQAEGEMLKALDNKITVLKEILTELEKQRLDKAETLPYALKAKQFEDQILAIAFEENKGYTTDFGKVNFRKSYLKRSWSLDELDTACAIDPYIKEKIWQFKEEKPVKASASVEVFL